MCTRASPQLHSATRSISINWVFYRTRGLGINFCGRNGILFENLKHSPQSKAKDELMVPIRKIASGDEDRP